MQTPAGHFLGAKRDKPDTRDQRYRMAPQYGAMAAPLPPLVDLRSSLPPAFDQGETSSCGPNSAAALMCHQFPEYAKGSFSRMQIYADVRTLEDDFSLDGGVETRDLFKVLTKTGAASELLWPFDITKMFVQPPVTLAPKQKLASYARLVQEDDFLECLSEGFPFILGFICFESIDNDALARTAVMPMPDSSKEKQVGGHDVLVVGYDLNFKSSAVFKKSGVDAALVSDHALLIRNSWGTDWADAGHFWMPIGYASNPSLGGDCWTGRRDAVPTDAVPVPPKHVTPTPGQIAAAVAATRRTFDANGARWMSNDMCVKIGNSTATAVVNNHERRSIMKKILLASLLAASLGGCMITAGGTGTPVPAPFPSTGNTTIDAVIAEAQTICGFAPAVGTVSSILDTFVPGTAIVGTIANGICNALNRKAVRRGAVAPVYRGVRIEGHRV